MPGWTSTVIACASKAVTLRRCLLSSMTSASPTVWPHWLVPPPRGRIGTFDSRASSIAATTSSSSAGTTTPTGSTW